jgi:cell division protein FtsL
MIIGWKELSMSTKVFYIVGLVSAIGLAVMILSGKVSIWDVITWKFKLCPWCM